MKIVKGILKALLIIVLILVVIVAAALVFLTVAEYKPADRESITVESLGGEAKSIKPGDSIKLLSWNLGFGALGDNADFFMDGGKMVYPADEARVRTNIDAFVSEVKAQDADIVLFQEIDKDSDRSYTIPSRGAAPFRTSPAWSSSRSAGRHSSAFSAASFSKREKPTWMI